MRSDLSSPGLVRGRYDTDCWCVEKGDAEILAACNRPALSNTITSGGRHGLSLFPFAFALLSAV